METNKKQLPLRYINVRELPKFSTVHNRVLNSIQKSVAKGVDENNQTIWEVHPLPKDKHTTPVLLNLSEKALYIQNLLKLNNYNYFWKEAGITPLVGRHVDGRPVIKGALDKNVFKSLIERVHKVNIAGKELIDLRYLVDEFIEEAKREALINKDENGETGKILTDDEALEIAKQKFAKTLIAIGGMYGVRKHTMEIDRYGIDKRKARDAFGLEMSYKMTDYERLDILIDKRIGHSTVKSFGTKMRFFKDVFGKLEVINVYKIAAFYNGKNKDHYTNTFKKEISEVKSVDPVKLYAYSRVFGVEMEACSCEEEYLAIMQWYRHNYKEYVDSTVGAEYLLNVVEAYQDKFLAQYVFDGLLGGTLDVREDLVFEEFSFFASVVDVSQLTDICVVTAYGNEDYMNDEVDEMYNDNDEVEDVMNSLLWDI